MEYNNTIYFENGIEHTLTEKELVVIKRLLHNAKVGKNYEEELENLQNLFLEHLDWLEVLTLEYEKTIKEQIQDFYLNGGTYDEIEIDFGEPVGDEDF